MSRQPRTNSSFVPPPAVQHSNASNGPQQQHHHHHHHAVAKPSSDSNSHTNTPFVSSHARPRKISFGLDEGPSFELSEPSIVWNALCCNAGRGSLSWLGLGIVTTTLACGSLGIHILLDQLGDKLDSISGGMYTGLGTLAILLVLIAVPLTHGIVGGVKNGPLYQFFQPFVGGLRFVLLQVLAWSLWTATVLGGIYGVYVGGKKLTAGWLSAVGVGGVVSQVLVLISLHFFVSQGSTNQNAQLSAMKAERARSHREKVREAKRKKHEAIKTKLRNNNKRVEEEPEAEPVEGSITPPASGPVALATALKNAASTSMWPWGSFAMKVTFFVIATLSLLLALFVESTSVSTSTTVSLQSLLTSAILLAVPITHLLARRSLTHAGYLLFQPFKGGSKFVTLQAIAWTLWTLAFVSAGFSFFMVALKHPSIPIDEEVAPELPRHISWPWLSNLITSAGLGGILSQALVLLSLKYFDAKLSRRITTQARVLELVRSEASATPHAHVGKGVNETDVYDRAVQMLSSPIITKRHLWTAASPKSGEVTVPSPTATAEKRLSDYVDEDEVSIPTLIPVARPAAVDSLEVDTSGTESPDEISPAEAPVTLASIKLQDLKQSLHFTWYYYRSAKWTPLFHELLKDVRAFLVISVLYMVPIVGATLTFAPLVMMFVYWPVPWYIQTLYGSFVLLYLSTYRGRPGITGERSWSSFRNNDLLWDSMQRYFNGQVIPLGSLNDAHGPYIFGFHPHGVYPMTCFWATRGSDFQRHYPGLHIDICGASIMFNAPLLREICMWAGGREVSGTAIRMALKAKRSIMLVPGGQREMRHSVADPRFLTLITRHRGFIRMALEHGTPLVPVLSIGETMLLQNVHAPRIQAYTLRTIGVGFPIWPYGRWYSPLPNPHPVVVVFGHPIPVPLNKEPSAELIEEVHRVYYQQLQEMFLAHRHLIPGFENCTLVFKED